MWAEQFDTYTKAGKAEQNALDVHIHVPVQGTVVAVQIMETQKRVVLIVRKIHRKKLNNLAL